ncbi:MAG TPA: ribosome maturation factor RimM [Candidatus Binataceae bacterium]|nr:ribosome maturation factor RimM [Candidatus Binataceae bacterium]
MPPANRLSRPPTKAASPDAAADATQHPSPEMIRIGRIAGPHGLRGALRYKPDNPDSDSLREIDSVTIDLAGVRHDYRLIDIARIGHGMLKLDLEGIADVDAAEALKGGIVMVAAADLPPAKADEFYYFEAIGCDVMLTDGSRIGALAEIFSNGAHDVMVVREGKREILVPVVDHIVKSVDLQARRIVIEPVPGLLD